MKKSNEIIQHLQNKISGYEVEAVACAKKFMANNSQSHKDRSQKLFEQIEYNKELIKFIQSK
jgi:RNase H-fold protein (predicted Holliday junction resolvase)